MKKIPLSNGKFTMVDDENYELLRQFKWHPQICGKYVYAYRRHKINNKKTTISMHRSICFPPKNMEIDHIDGNGLNNIKKNLRICTTSLNQANSKKRKNTSSTYKGVSWHKILKKWQTRIRLNGKEIHAGYFQNEIDAAKAYDLTASNFFGDFAKLNFEKKRIKNGDE